MSNRSAIPLKPFASTSCGAASSLKATNFTLPNAIEHFPPEVTIKWNKISGFINMGGVGTADYYRPIRAEDLRAGDPFLTPPKTSPGSDAGGQWPRGYCCSFNSPSGCHDRSCPYIHSNNPPSAGRGSFTTSSTGERGRARVNVSAGEAGGGGGNTGDKSRSRSVGHGTGGRRGGRSRAAGEGGARPKTADFFTHGKDI